MPHSQWKFRSNISNQRNTFIWFESIHLLSHPFSPLATNLSQFSSYPCLPPKYMQCNPLRGINKPRCRRNNGQNVYISITTRQTPWQQILCVYSLCEETHRFRFAQKKKNKVTAICVVCIKYKLCTARNLLRVCIISILIRRCVF